MAKRFLWGKNRTSVQRLMNFGWHHLAIINPIGERVFCCCVFGFLFVFLKETTCYITCCLYFFFNDEFGKPDRSLNLIRVYNALQLINFSSFKEFKQKPQIKAQRT